MRLFSGDVQRIKKSARRLLLIELRRADFMSGGKWP